MKSKQIISVLLLISFLVLSDHSSAQSDNTDTSQEIKNILSDYYDTMSDRDWPAYKKFFSDDATLTTIWQKPNDTIPNIHTNTITSFIAQTKDGPDSQPIFEEKMTDADIEVRNNLAQAWVKYEAKFGSAEMLHEWKGIDLFSFIRYQGEWKIVSIVFEAE